MEGSPPPRFSETMPRFTEHLSGSSSPPSPPYQPYPNKFPDQNRYSQSAPEATDSSYSPIQHRLSNKDRPMSPELMSPGLESVRADEGEKEVYSQLQPDAQASHDGKKASRICGMSKKWFWILLALILLMIVGLGAGLGAGFGTKHSSSSASASPTNSSTASPSSTSMPSASASSEFLIGGALGPQYYSTTGAFNGSGIALASQSFGQNDEGALVMYFQHWTGQIRWQQLSTAGDWIGGTESEIVASDAKNGTPISAVAYALNMTSTWHIFYIDTNNTIKQRSNNNISNVWVDGTINAANLVANDADQVGMQACWYGSDYGDSDYSHTPLPGQSGSNSSASGDAALTTDVGMHMWYASDDTTFQQLGWRDGDTDWTFQESWTDMNGHAGVGCYSWGPGTTTYVMFVNMDNSVEFWWKDTNTSLPSTNTHPINVWTNTSIGIPDVFPSTSLGYTNYFYAQMDDTLMLNGYNISWAAENTSIVTTDDFTVQGVAGLPGTHISVCALPNTSGGNSLTVFYQQIGNDVTEYVRDFDGGQWTSAQLPLPAT